ncbi:MAG TPA: S1C family serine protease [Solirubrobacteraceae bacterium]|jgi:serine protease Do|nr:S1C family serine protease [Solirubrobacteraceae bacterium]
MADQHLIDTFLTGPARSVVGLGEGARGGSGVVIGDGKVLTLARNLRGSELSLAFADGRRERAKLLAADPDVGVAVLDAATGETPPLEWSDVDAPAIGTRVFALADPGGRGLRLTEGAVASAPRSLRGPRGRMLEDLIEHTAPLPRGSGGGPLLDEQGRLLGVNAVRLAHGFILALPGARIREHLPELAEGRARAPRRLGVAVVPGGVARRLRRAVGLPERDGVLVRAVEQGSAAERAGVERGDLIVALGERTVDSLDALFGALDAAAADQPVSLHVVRGVEERELHASLEAR